MAAAETWQAVSFRCSPSLCRLYQGRPSSSSRPPVVACVALDLAAKGVARKNWRQNRLMTSLGSRARRARSIGRRRSATEQKEGRRSGQPARRHCSSSIAWRLYAAALYESAPLPLTGGSRGCDQISTLASSVSARASGGVATRQTDRATMADSGTTAGASVEGVTNANANKSVGNAVTHTEPALSQQSVWQCVQCSWTW